MIIDSAPSSVQAQLPRKIDSFEVFASKMTTGIACASGGAVIGSLFGPLGSTIGAGLSGTFGFIFGRPGEARAHEK
jgi:hypothetical protein